MSPSSTPPAWPEAVAGWLAYLAEQRNYASNTVESYRRDLGLLEKHVPVSTWWLIDQVALRQAMVLLHRRGSSARSLARHLSAWRQFFAFCQSLGWLEQNPAEFVFAPKSVKALPPLLSVDRMAQLLDQVVADDSTPLLLRDRAMFELMYSCGLRVSELTGACVERLDSDQVLWVRGKGGRQRGVPVGRHAQQALARWQPWRDQWAKASVSAWFVSAQGKGLSTRTVQLRLIQFAQRAGLSERVHPHMLRHAFATHVLESSGDIRAVQEMLGHRDIRSTQVYTHLDFNHLARVYENAHPRASRLDTAQDQ